jgi:hypothetical protein
VCVELGLPQTGAGGCNHDTDWCCQCYMVRGVVKKGTRVKGMRQGCWIGMKWPEKALEEPVKGAVWLCCKPRSAVGESG